MVGSDDLGDDMMYTKSIVSLLKDKDVACEFYAAICNMYWKKIEEKPEEEKIIDKLLGNKPIMWSASWRYAGSLIAKIRNKYYNTTEDYMDFYCSGGEGTVSPLVEEEFRKIGWEQYL